MSLVDSLGKLQNALGSYYVAHEQRMDEQGLDMAQRLINSETPEDVKNLSALDAAQTYGYMSVADNPYFRAHAEKLRGAYLSTEAKREYDETYANTPAKSLAEEQKRYVDFMKSYQDKTYEQHEPTNKVAFGMGWSDGVSTNAALVANNYVNKEIDTDAKVTYAESKAQLGQLVQDSFNILQEKDKMTNSANAIFNNTKLMGLDPQLRLQLASDFVNQMVSTGHMTWEQIEPMLHGVKIGTRLNGEQQSLYDILDPQGIKTAAFNYRKQFLTKFQYDFSQKHKGDPNPDKAFKEVDDLKAQGKFEEAELLARQMPAVISAQEAEKQRKAAALAAQSKKSLKKTVSASRLRQDFDGWMKNGTSATIPDLDSSEVESLFQDSLAYYTQKGSMSDETQMAYFANFLRYPKFSKQLSNLKDSAEMAMDNILPDGDGNVVLSPTLDGLNTFYENQPQSFLSIMGSDLHSRMSILHTLRDAFGEDEGLQKFAQFNALPDEERSAALDSARKTLVDGMMNIEGMHSLGGGSTATVYFQDSDELLRTGRDIYGALRAAGISDDTALRKTMNSIQDNYAYYHGAVIPRGSFNNLGTADNEGYGQKALDAIVYDYADTNGLSPESVTVKYDSRIQRFTFSGGDSEQSYSLSTVRSSALWLAEQGASSNEPEAKQSVDIDETNEERNSSNNINPEEVHGTGLHGWM